LLDTSTCVFFLRGKHHLDEIIKEKGLENCFISEISVLELKYGAENSDDPKKSQTGQRENNLPVTAPKKTIGTWCQGKGLFPELTYTMV
jgi:predicted nucleic acid-binding protein